MEITSLDRTASLARILGAVLSFFDLILVLPHLDGFEPANLASPLYVAGLLVAFIWLPLLWLHVQTSGKHLSVLELTASFGPLLLFAAFFGFLFAFA